MLKLIIEDDEGRKTVVPFVRDEITIGRQEGNTIRLTERNVSRRHARLLRQQTNVLIEDLGSYNGIKVNGDRITGQVQVQDGDLIQIGDYDLAIQREEDARSAQTVPLEPNARTTAPMAPTMKLPDPGATMPALPVVPEAAEEDVQEAPAPEEPPRHQSTAVIRVDQIAGNRPQRSVVSLSPSEAPRLVVLNTDFAGREFPCTKTELRIGRTDDNDIAIDHRSLSRTHCKVVREDSGEWKVIDLQSANGLMVNGESYAQVTLRLGDTLELGHVKMKFVGPGESVALAAASSAETGETSQSSSKGPIIAVVATLAVLILGGGGYALFKSGGGTELPKPVKVDPTVQIDPPKIDKDVPKVTPPVPDEPKQPEPDNEAILAEGMAAIGELDVVTAEATLRQCKVGESLCPKAQQLLTQLANEKPFAKMLIDARKALDANDLVASETMLTNSRQTKLFADVHKELQDRRALLVKAAVAKVPPEVKPVPNLPPPVDLEAEKAKKIERLLADAKAAKKDQKFSSAIGLLKECLKIDKKNADCTVSLASTYATKGSATNNDADNDEAKRLYQTFLTIAPPGDSRIERVKTILKGESQ